ncbi:MAG: capsule assembly Wzi family protein [Bacteroidota bacterium]
MKNWGISFQRSLAAISAVLFFCTSAGGQHSPNAGDPEFSRQENKQDRLLAQSSLLLPGNPAYDWLERARIKVGDASITFPSSSPALFPLEREEIARLADSFSSKLSLSFTDQFWLDYIKTDNWRFFSPVNNSSANSKSFDELKPRDRTFYKTPANLFEVNTPDFYLRINPILDLRYGRMQDDREDYFYNRRGVDLWGGLDQKVHFHFQLLETQRSLPNYLRQFRQQTGGVPGAGFLKDYEFEGFNVRSGVDFLQSVGYVGLNISKHLSMRFGYGSQFIGRGERSLLLSDFSNNYPYLQLNWRVWKIHYQNIFAELTNGPTALGSPGMPLPKKYLAAHHLGLHIGKRLEVGIFESVIFNREEGFEWGYLNPVILYRTVEQSLGSPDNVLLGFDLSYTLPPSLLFYGQLVLDEFVFRELFVERRGWWANKFGYQLGLKYVDAFGLDQLDLRVEHNGVRPYTYTHRTALSNYSHFGMPLAHPLGANFTETILHASYRPFPRLRLDGRIYLIDQGEGAEDRVVGQDINLPSDDREQDFGNETGQGIAYSNTVFTAEASYMLKHNLFLEATFLNRDKDSEIDARDLATTYLYLGIRWNVGKRRDWF